jgi:hypothetical protein
LETRYIGAVPGFLSCFYDPKLRDLWKLTEVSNLTELLNLAESCLQTLRVRFWTTTAHVLYFVRGFCFRGSDFSNG